VSLFIRDAHLSHPLLLFTKVFDPKDNYEERQWLDVRIGLDWSGIDFNTHEFILQADPKSAFCLSEPRYKKGAGKAGKIIFVVFDGVRSDHVGCYGYQRNTTPHIDAFSKDAVLFRQAQVQGEWTLTSFMSFLTGLYPSAHGVFHPTLYQHLHPKITTLPQILREHGFINRCYFTHKRLVSNFGFARGFDSHIFRQCDKENRIAFADDVMTYGVDMLDFHKDDDLFLMLHFFDTHQPCNPASPYSDIFDKTYPSEAIKDVRTYLLKNKKQSLPPRDIQNLIARYDAEIYRQDKRFGLLVEYLKATGGYDEATIIFTSDHGMLLGDHGDLATIQLFDESLRVPLLIKFPYSICNKRGVEVSDAAIESNLDIMPTILDLLSIKNTAPTQGKSLLTLVNGRSPGGNKEDSIISESFFKDTYTVSIRDKDSRYTAKADCDFSDISKIDFKVKNEKLYEIRDISPTEIERKDNFGMDRYRQRVFNHVQEIKDYLERLKR
ncbi:MAG TPA: sulfatase, partial [Candidatus Margulisiibacteriota bacterium]|nr:sulfatase [Candidatus Margulisiibacteriota bacterium]